MQHVHVHVLDTLKQGGCTCIRYRDVLVNCLVYSTSEECMVQYNCVHILCRLI